MIIKLRQLRHEKGFFLKLFIYTRIRKFWILPLVGDAIDATGPTGARRKQWN